MAVMADWAMQNQFSVRLEWGPTGARELAPEVAAVVVIDVLSFTTTVSVAVERGIAVYPYPWRDESATDFARAHDAALAGGRRTATAENPWTLSPAALRHAPPVERLVLPSPNGSAISSAVPSDRTVLAASLRNASATAAWLRANGFGTGSHPVLVVPAGERWPDGSLRPALEDYLGAGAVVAALAALAGTPGELSLSSEAATAAEAFVGTKELRGRILGCTSGVELCGQGFGEDVEIALELDASSVSAVRKNGAFTPAG